MVKWRCIICGYVYDTEIGDPDHKIAPGTAFEDVPDRWHCPVCAVPKKFFGKFVGDPR